MTMRLLIGLLLLSPTGLPSQQPDPSVASLQRIYASADFQPERFGPSRWLGDGSSYTTVERVAGSEGQEIVRYDTEKGTREVLISAAQLTPRGATATRGLSMERGSFEAPRLH